MSATAIHSKMTGLVKSVQPQDGSIPPYPKRMRLSQSIYASFPKSTRFGDKNEEVEEGKADEESKEGEEGKADELQKCAVEVRSRVNFELRGNGLITATNTATRKLTKRPRPCNQSPHQPKRTRMDSEQSPKLSIHDVITSVTVEIDKEAVKGLFGTRRHRRAPKYYKTIAKILELCLSVMMGLMGANRNVRIVWQRVRVAVANIKKITRLRKKQTKRSSYETKTIDHDDASAYITRLMHSSDYFQSKCVETTAAATAAICTFRADLSSLQDSLNKGYACLKRTIV